jgi:adenylate cyclase
MTSPKLQILEGDRLAFETPFVGPVEVGRQRAGEPEPFTLVPGVPGVSSRLIIARLQESKWSRRHLLLQPVSESKISVTNLTQQPLVRPGHAPMLPGAVAELSVPTHLVLESLTIKVVSSAAIDEFGTQGLDQMTVAPGSLMMRRRLTMPLPNLNAPQTDELMGWLQTTVGVLQSTVGAADFLDKAAQALVHIVGLDEGRVLLLRGEKWEPVAVSGPASRAASWRPSQHVLNRVREEKRTFWQLPQMGGGADSASLISAGTVLASPLLDGNGDVMGALYGERRFEPLQRNPGEAKLEALLVDMLACAVSTGLAREDQQRQALEMQVQFEQFFSQDLALQLRREPKLLEGKDVEVTLLFADIRGFSRIAGKLGPAGTMQWIGEVMGELSECVMNHDGVALDYIGDELLAMWGAPRPQPDQALRAVEGALSMREAVVRLDRAWRDRAGEPMDIGIGINTGIARVGNIGSRHKFKYGTLGDSVNIASRTQGLTKYLGRRMLITEATRKRLPARFLCRRVVTARLVNIAEPVRLYEVEVSESEERRQLFRVTEEALEALENRDFAAAAQRVGALMTAHPTDRPLLLILARATAMLTNPEAPFDPVWAPPGK